VFEDVLYAPLAGLTHKERAYLALILFHSYTSKTQTSNQDAINLLLTQRERHAARILGSAIRFAVVASGRSPELLKQLSVSAEDGVLTIAAKPDWNNVLTKRVEHRLQKLGELLGHEIRVEL